jgi:hypothetical protein
MEFSESMVVVNHDHLCAIMHIAHMISFVFCRSPLEYYNALSDAIQIFYQQHKISDKSLMFSISLFMCWVCKICWELITLVLLYVIKV